jgi:acetylornithine deacetylase/succinyl-diaminopimelate desuccinylase-like protein
MISALESIRSSFDFADDGEYMIALSVTRRLAMATSAIALFASALTIAARAQDVSSWSEPAWEAVEKEALQLLSEYLKIDTTNPPGNETRAVKFFAAICEKEGIEHIAFEPIEGRATLWARLRGDGSKRPIILLNHTDVVPHSPEFWSVPAFSATEKDGFLYGRGAMDMKSLGIAQFATLLALKRIKAPLKRDLIFLATADEEAGGKAGAGWFVANHPELIKGAEYLLNEGGGNLVETDGSVRAIGLGPSEKTPVWLRLISTGTPGHASVPITDSAVNRLVRALNRLLDYKPPIQITPAVEQMFRAAAPSAPAAWREKFSDLRAAVKDPNFISQIESDPRAVALLRNTISLTVLEGSGKINVIPPRAVAEIDTRVVPGEKIDRWVAEIRSVIADETIKIEPILAFEANASPIENELVAALRTVVARRHPGATLTYPVLAGFTDSHYFRPLGINSYGLSPFVAAPKDLGGGYHGNDERIGIKPFTQGIRLYFEIIAEVVK